MRRLRSTSPNVFTNWASALVTTGARHVVFFCLPGRTQTSAREGFRLRGLSQEEADQVGPSAVRSKAAAQSIVERITAEIRDKYDGDAAAFWAAQEAEQDSEWGIPSDACWSSRIDLGVVVVAVALVVVVSSWVSAVGAVPGSVGSVTVNRPYRGNVVVASGTALALPVLDYDDLV